jgi:hypothetical protein
MPQVLRPDDYTETNESTDFGTFELNKQMVVSTVTCLILGSWIASCYLNGGLFFKEATLCSSIIFLLVFIKSKSVKKD